VSVPLPKKSSLEMGIARDECCQKGDKN